MGLWSIQRSEFHGSREQTSDQQLNWGWVKKGKHCALYAVEPGQGEQVQDFMSENTIVINKDVVKHPTMRLNKA